ncbi:MAG: DUF2528 family protein [Halothiobacillaceae bacterium]
MQAQQPISSDIQANTESSIKRYRVIEPFSDYEVTLEVDHSILTADLAQMINEFWSNHDLRKASEGGDEVKAVIRFAGVNLVGLMLENGWGGANFGTNNGDAGKYWSEQLRSQEGWPGEDGTPFGHLGIRVVGAQVSVPDFDEFHLEEMT